VSADVAIGAQVLRYPAWRAQVGVSIDQTRQQRLALEIDDLGTGRRNGPIHRGDTPISEDDRDVLARARPVPSTTSAPVSAGSLATALCYPARIHGERMPGDEPGLVRDEPSDTLDDL
jgi:hypothetical protein